ncbi:Zn(2)-C6 fungal-type domain-containing protein [Fusarium sp. Ph1]|nr:Zn(2)-C6 fungal-type domain-containing protein [Fusarium sp. Ph1]
MVKMQPDGSGDIPMTATFRVSTANDFLPSSQLIRSNRSRLSSKACRMCRARKVKCHLGDNSSESSCRACRQANMECVWDTTDGRKRRKLHVRHEQAAGGSTEAHPSRAGGSPKEHLPSQVNAETRPANQLILPDLESDPPSLFGIGDPAYSFDRGHSPMPMPWPQAGILNMDNEGLGTMAMSPAWPVVEDYLLNLDTVTLLSEHNDSASVAIPAAKARPKQIRLRIFRRYGPTAVAPGLKRLSVAIGARPDRSSRPLLEDLGDADMSISTQQTPSSVTSPGCRSDVVPDCFYGLPFDTVYRALDVFFQTFGGHFPFLNKHILASHVRSRQASKFLISSVLALTARFCPADMFQLTTDSDSEPGHECRTGAQFLKAAKEQLICLLAVPAPDVVAGLIVLSWAEFGSNSGEGGLWMFSGMAIRMAQDLGLHRSDTTDLDPRAAFYDHAPPTPQGIRVPTDQQSILHQQKSRLVMFWSVFTLDVYVSLVMGRPPTIRRAEIEVPLPTSDDMKPVHLDFDGSHKMCHFIFPAMARSMYAFSEAVELFNLNKGAESTYPLKEIDDLEKKVAQCHKQLDASLLFSTDTYRKSLSDGHGGLFLMLHLYFYTFAALLSTRRSHSRIAHEKSKRSAQVACHKILQTLAIAEAIDDKGYTATPFLAYSIFVVASTLLEDMEVDTEGAGDFITAVDFADIDFLNQKLREMSRFFHGVNATIDAIDLKRRGWGPDSSNDTEDGGDAERHSVLELQDGGIINRYTIPTTTNEGNPSL